MRHYQGYRDDHVLRMPWRRFLALSEEIEAHERRQRDQRFFRDRGLMEEWDENQEEWLRLQPPPE